MVRRVDQRWVQHLPHIDEVLSSVWVSTAQASPGLLLFLTPMLCVSRQILLSIGRILVVVVWDTANRALPHGPRLVALLRWLLAKLVAQETLVLNKFLPKCVV